MGLNENNVLQLREGEADYILALKGNHGNLLDDVRLFMETEVEKSEQKNCIDGFNEVKLKFSIFLQIIELHLF